MRSAPLVAVLALAVPASAQVIHVDDTAVGANDGTSWQDAFTDLQSALAVAAPNDVIWVARGNYKPTATLDRFVTFSVNNDVYGGFDGTEATFDERANLFDETILSGDLLGNDGPDFTGYADNSENVVTFPGTGVPTFDGFTVRGGNASSAQWSTGGGLVIDPFSFGATVRNCTFIANYARHHGGGIGCYTLDAVYIDRCTFIGNRTRGNGGGVAGAMRTTVRSCRFLGNSAVRGGGLFHAEAALDCVFSGNRSTGRGGGAYGTELVANCTFSRNSASIGGGLYGPAPWNALAVLNCVFSGNVDVSGVPQTGQAAGGLVIDESLVEGWNGSIPGTGSFDGDPLFRSPLGADGIAGTLDDDLRLEFGSPCVDTARQTGYASLGIDAIGRPRFVDSLGCDGIGILDRGALERQTVDGTTTYCDSTASSIGVPAIIGGPCTVDLSGGAITILSRPIPDGRAFLLMGDAGTPLPFGNGNLCLSGQIRRVGTAIPSGGTASFLVDPLSLPGATVGLQVLFRDAAAGGAGFNLSSAMRLLALP